MFIKENKRINPHATIIVDDVVYQGNILFFPAAMEKAGITEIKDPTPPEDYTEDSYYKTDSDYEPYVIYTRKSDEQIRAAELSKIPDVSPWQIRKALNQLGLRDQVEETVKLSSQDVKDAWEFASFFSRTNPWVMQLGGQLGKTEQEMDELFKLAATL